MEETRIISGADAELVMRFDKPYGSAQGMAIRDGLLFQLYHKGRCAVYDMVSRTPSPLCVFPLGSVNDGVPDKHYLNHSNQCMFSTLHAPDNRLPLLYVTIGYGGGADEDGYFYRCAAEDIRLRRDASGAVTGAEAKTLQTISYRASEMREGGYENPCWGCPAWFVDSENGWLYIHSARYRTTKEFLEYYEQNRYIITKFRLPDPMAGGHVTLGAGDILDQFTTPFDILFTQGGMLAKEKIFYTFGAGHDPYPNGLRVFDLKEKRIVAAGDFSDSCFAEEEIESCSFFGGKLYCNTNAKPQGGIYCLGSEWAELVQE